MRIRLATRGSALALTQSGMIATALRERGHEVDLVTVVTAGDTTPAPLALLGGHGVFVGAVRAAVLSGDCDIAVHSLKDLPVAAQPGLRLAAVPLREDPADALCCRDARSLADLPPGAVVGTGSPRRAAQVLARRPDLTIRTIRGNVETRLRRLDRDLDAVVLAMAGLRRIGRADAVSERLDPRVFVPAPGQGALAIECRADDAAVTAALAPLDDPATRLAVTAERAVLTRLDAGCTAPVGALATVSGGRLSLAADVLSDSGAARVRAFGDASADLAAASVLGTSVAEDLLRRGAERIVDLHTDHSATLRRRRILLPLRAPEGLAAAMGAAGADLVRASLTRLEPMPLDEYRALAAERWDWLVATSPHTIRLLGEPPLVPSGARVAAVGPTTAAALDDAGVHPDLIAVPGGGASLVAAFPPGPGRVLLPGARHPSAEPGAGLAAKGWIVRRVGIYETVQERIPAEIVTLWREFDAFVVTAGSVARAVVAAAGLPGPPVIAIGESSAAAARDLGLTVAAVAATPDATGLFTATVQALKNEGEA